MESTNKPDFPAAHSMDTEWYAVDAEGHVAHFSTGEAGRAPTSALEGRSIDDELPSIEDLILNLPADSTIEYYVDDLASAPGGPVFDYAWETGQFESVAFSDVNSCYSALMLLRDESLFSAQPPTARTGLLSFFRVSNPQVPDVQRIRNSKHILGFVRDALPVSQLRSWINSGVVMKAWVNHGLSPNRVGIFSYEHGSAFENWISGPYLRRERPGQPLKLEQFPEHFRQLFNHTRFPKARFARDIAVDPGEVGPCAGWDTSWVSLDGIVHREEEEQD